MKKGSIRKKIISLTAAVIVAVSSAGAALPASAYTTSSKNPGLFYLKTDTTETDLSGIDKAKGKVLRKGFYTGYQLNDDVVAVAVGYGYKTVSVDSAALRYKSNMVNSINVTGAYSQLSGKNRTGGYYNGFPYGCGPTAASSLITYEMSLPYNNSAVKNTDVISYYRGHPKEAAGFLFSGTLKTWCLYDGTSNRGVKKMIADYSARFGKTGSGVVMFDPADFKTPAALVNRIDFVLRSGRRVLVTVRCASDEGKKGTKNKYVKSKEGTHYIVIVAENGYTNGKYFICDPWYVEGERYEQNGYNYYYGMQYSSKLAVAKSMMNAGGDLERSMIFVKK